MPDSSAIRVYGLAPESIVDGPGLRFAVFVQGCTHGCPGCHNPESHPHEGGRLRSVDEIIALVQAERIIHDVTLSGGDPFEQPGPCAELARRLKGLGYGVWAYTGYLYEDLRSWKDADARVAGQGAAQVADLLQNIDVLVDGPFVQSLKSLELGWRGSSNQRVIDLARMRKAGDMDTVILWKKRYEPPAKPKSW